MNPVGSTIIGGNPQLRKDPIIGRWVIIAAERGKRPLDFAAPPQARKAVFCPFCPGHEDKTPREVLAYRPQGAPANSGGWWLRVVPNKFPVLRVEGNLDRQGEGMYDLMNGIGAHDVIIETPHHGLSMADYPPRIIEEVLWAYRDRMTDLRRDIRLKYLLIFKNHGASAGASLAHPHSQLIAVPVVPKRVAEELRGARRYHRYRSERCVFCDLIRQELRDGVRVVAENSRFIAIAPYASRFPFETWIMPKYHASHFEDIQKSDVQDLAPLFRDVMARLKLVLDDPPYNFILHTSPAQKRSLPYYHWHIEIIPKVIQVAGFEWGTGFYINPVPPEDAARHMIDATPPPPADVPMVPQAS